MGCFWEPSESLLEVDGVIDTVVGYTGNPFATQAPTYDSVCYSRQPWVEGVRVRYDDEKLSYEQLLNEFFERQKSKVGSRQYASVIFTNDKEQEAIAKQWMIDNSTRIRTDGWTTQMTSIEPTTKFYQAEGYHQRYWQKQRPRLATILVMLAVASGIFDSITPEAYQSVVASVANTLGLLVGGWILLERLIDSKVIELD